MSEELNDLLISYFMRWKSVGDCAEWLAAVDWENAQVGPESMAEVGRLELIATEVLEGLRPEGQFWQEAAEVVARSGKSVYEQMTQENIVKYSTSNDKVEWSVDLNAVASAEALQSWSISPLQVF
jgi:hypothetical protein